MHKLVVLYNEPKDPTHFRKYYVETHLPPLLPDKAPAVGTLSRQSLGAAVTDIWLPGNPSRLLGSAPF